MTSLKRDEVAMPVCETRSPADSSEAKLEELRKLAMSAGKVQKQGLSELIGEARLLAFLRDGGHDQIPGEGAFSTTGLTNEKMRAGLAKMNFAEEGDTRKWLESDETLSLFTRPPPATDNLDGTDTGNPYLARLSGLQP